MTSFLDSSALVKLYVPERGHEVVRSLDPPLVVSSLASVEVPAAFWRKERAGELSAGAAAILSDALISDLRGTDTEERADGTYAVVDAGPRVLERASKLVALHPLRAYDAVQLASALVVQDAIAAPVVLAAFDLRLRTAAAREGLSLSPLEV